LTVTAQVVQAGASVDAADRPGFAPVEEDGDR